ncbi:NAD(P)-dependent alcohol dehydrogenase [Asticcacaulis sp. BYS171W]|uniref:NAD(P)-dependent alcohol dehydrogenase n=1 Tax=Asticcacaulis aquaticus TaxID=2984212 RepID=A0ABT5HUM7_9CAUL|nr:NAD(P)-dependent alcohol dehydrogenase [Asticcacaulis aquaticus]MDC7683749.1 NAD(P)-dependent alcohol dehydrogenase [Asticcacaulis aquaticus]
MCIRCNDPTHTAVETNQGRRSLLFRGFGLAGAATLGNSLVSATSADAAPAKKADLGSSKARAWAATSPTSSFSQIEIKRRAVGPNDVQMQVLYSGICHSDIHMARSEWAPVTYPIVPGHEIIGRVTAVGANVTKFRVGDIGGVGCMVNSCGTCVECLNDREHACLNGMTLTYNAPDKESGGVTYGGYSSSVVVTEKFVIRIPPGVNLAGMAPVLCAGITTFSPLQHWKASRGQKVGVIGFGGLGHMAVKLAVAKGADVTVFTTTPSKRENALKMGAKAAVLWEERNSLREMGASFDLLIAAVPQAFEIQPFMNLLKTDATLVNVGTLESISGYNAMLNNTARRNLSGSMIGGIAETQQVVDFCSARNITADVELIRPDQINEAFSRVVNKDVKFRFVIDMAAA